MLILPSSNADEYRRDGLRGVICKIVNPLGQIHGNYDNSNRPSWWPVDVVFKSPSRNKNGEQLTVAQLRKVLAAFLDNCQDQYTISPAAKSLCEQDSPVSMEDPTASDTPQNLGVTSSLTNLLLVRPKKPKNDRSSPLATVQQPPASRDATPIDLASPPVLASITTGIASGQPNPLSVRVEPTPSSTHAVSAKAINVLNGRLILPSSDANDYSRDGLRCVICKIVHAQDVVLGTDAYDDTNRPSWWPEDVPFRSPSNRRNQPYSLAVGQLRKIMTAFFDNCPDQYIIVPREQGSSSSEDSTATVLNCTKSPQISSSPANLLLMRPKKLKADKLRALVPTPSSPTNDFEPIVSSNFLSLATRIATEQLTPSPAQQTLTREVTTAKPSLSSVILAPEKDTTVQEPTTSIQQPPAAQTLSAATIQQPPAPQADLTSEQPTPSVTTTQQPQAAQVDLTVEQPISSSIQSSSAKELLQGLEKLLEEYEQRALEAQQTALEAQQEAVKAQQKAAAAQQMFVETRKRFLMLGRTISGQFNNDLAPSTTKKSRFM